MRIETILIDALILAVTLLNSFISLKTSNEVLKLKIEVMEKFLTVEQYEKDKAFRIREGGRAHRGA